jgi:hypothetical protein
MTLYFRNPGLVEMEALTTFGVNVKERENAIGHFGTGFKYAVGIILRLGGSVVVWRGLEKFEFRSNLRAIRGKDFDLVYLVQPDGSLKEVGMTTEVGKNWLPWMAYRELRCNAQDELGETSTARREPAEGFTLIVVECRDLELAHENADEFFVSGAPVYSLGEMELFASRPDEAETGVFYKGVRVGDFRRPAMFRYNFTSHLMLTEDRTLSSSYYADTAVQRGYAHCTDADLLRQVLVAKPETMEGGIDFGNISSACEVFLDTAEEVIKQKPQHYNLSLRKALSRLRNHDPYEWVDPSVLEAKMLMKAENICLQLGMPTHDTEIRVVDNLGANVLGECHGNNVYLARRVFMMGTKMVAGTLYEEMIHKTYGHADESRAMQNFLLDRLMSEVELRTGEPM